MEALAVPSSMVTCCREVKEPSAGEMTGVSALGRTTVESWSFHRSLGPKPIEASRESEPSPAKSQTSSLSVQAAGASSITTIISASADSAY